MTFIGASVPYHQQDTDVYCGPASAQMILAGLSGTVQPQPQLAAAGLSSPSVNGGTPPSALCRVLSQAQPGMHFTENCDSTADAGCQRIVMALMAQSPSGVAVLVKGSSHWVVVTGAQLPDDPQGPPYAIDGFYVNDPEPITAAMFYAADQRADIVPPPMEHKQGDHCGCGDVYGAPIYVPLDEWKKSYWYKPSRIEKKAGFITISAGQLVLADVVFAERTVVEPDRRITEAKFAAWRGICDHRLAKQGPLAGCLADYELGDVTFHTELGQPAAALVSDSADAGRRAGRHGIRRCGYRCVPRHPGAGRRDARPG